MPAVAEVQFKASNSQQVVSAFNSVGTAAQTGATKIQQNSTAMSSLGKGMKSSVSSIGQVTTAFATLSLSIVSTWRAYRDLTDAQLAVDRANLKVKKTQEAIKKTTAEIAALQKAGNKGGLEAQRRRIDLTKLTKAAAEAEKKYGKNSLEAADARLKVKEAEAQGAGSSEKLRAAQEKLQIQQEQLGIAVTNAGEQQERFNDTQQNFYLSIIPTALSSLGLLTTAFKGLGGAITGGGGLGGFIKFFGPIGLAIAGLYLAFKTNFLGIKDIIGGVINWVKDRFGVWQQTIQDIFTLIQKGDWAGVFNLIRVAAVKFWNDLKKSVPFFGTVETIVNAIKEGKWSVAFDAIKTAALAWWADMKKAVPFLADLEKFLKGIAEGDWKGTFATIAKAAKTAFDQTIDVGIKWLLGENWKLGLEAKMLEVENEAKNRGTSVPIEIAREVNVSIIKVTGVDVLKWFKEHPLTAAVLPVSLGGISLAIEDPKFQAALAKGAEVILGALGTALSAATKTLDPYLAAVAKALNWNTAITSAQDALTNAGEAIWIWIFGGIKSGFGSQDWGKLFADFPAAVNDWWAKNAPQFQQQMIKNTKESPGGKLLAGAGLVNFDVNLTPKMDPNTGQIIQKSVESGGPYSATLGADAKTADKDVGAFKNRVERGKYIANLALEKKKAEQSFNQFTNKINNTTATIKIRAVTTGPFRNLGLADWGMHQHGYQSTVHRPTAFIAGEGGRPEDVTVRPRGSVQRGGGGGGGFSGTINVYVDGVLRPARYDMGARK